MPSADQLKALIKAYAQGDDAQFHSIAMQIAAGEARSGHGKLAEELRDLIDQSRVRVPSGGPSPIPITRPRGEVADLLTVSYPKTRLNDLILAPQTRKVLERVVREHKTIGDIRAHGLAPRKKLMLVGPPGTGKTMTASAIAGELALPLFTVRLDRLITRYMGETAAKLRLVFDAIAQTRAVYLFDEFDSIGSERGLTNDVGEIRRVVNSFLQMVEHDSSELGLRAKGLSYADITRAAEDALKHAIIEGRILNQSDLSDALAERRATLNHGAAKPKT
jgi:AAA+ superfamily predicted ATPase